MEKKPLSAIMLTLLLTSMLTFAFDIQPAKVVYGSIGPQISSWYKTELHHHSVFSDGYYDLGVVTQHAKDLGYNAFFLTDHDVVGFSRNKTFDDSLQVWQYLRSPSVWYEEWCVNELVPTPVYKGTYSLHLRSKSSDSSCQRYTAWRGPILWSGDIFLNFSLYPAFLSSPQFAGAFVELMFGLKYGWETDWWDSQCEGGVTWANGTVTAPHYVILRFGVLGSEGNVTEADETIRGFNFTVTLGAWNTFSLNVTDYMVRSLPTMLAPDCAISAISLNCITDHCEISDVYFDDVALYTEEPAKSVGELFAYRNEELASFDTGTFKAFPSVELSEFLHFNHFVYNFTTSQGYYHTKQVASSNNEVVNFVHSQGYPIQKNHPAGEPDVVEFGSFGADFIEARSQDEISVWDQLLNKGVCIMGTWSTDSHGFILQGDKCTMVYSPELTLEKLLKNMFEGRMFLMINNFTGKIVFNIEPSTEPYPARYINYIADGTSATLYFEATGLTSGWKACWVRNGTYFLDEAITSTTYAVSKSFSMPNDANYWRVEIRDTSDNIIAMSEPILFKKVHNMPSAMYAHVNDFATPTGTNYTNNVIKGITSASYSSNNLTLTIDGLGTSTTVGFVGNKGRPRAVFIDGIGYIHLSNTRQEFDSAFYNTWYYDPSTNMLYIKAYQSGSIDVIVDWIPVIAVPVGGYSYPILVHTKAEPIIPYIALIAILTAIFTKLRPKTKRKR